MGKQKIGRNWLKDIIFGGLIGLVNGFLGSGGGLLAVPVLEKTKKLPPKNSHATAIAVIFPLSLISAVVYSANYEFSIWIIIALGTGVTIGGIFGSIFLKKMNNNVIRIIFACLMLAGAIKMFF